MAVITPTPYTPELVPAVLMLLGEAALTWLERPSTIHIDKVVPLFQERETAIYAEKSYLCNYPGMEI